ncbi:MBL fold metallo-hydrolase [Echinicola jeungdonensis]|uniref:MBL fold metallo-hydrolase n=1 Tax=Echinicola jeungdonensis TaxID=709343 RepID=A0ABV5J347_9BACT|nr:MBL fold metallo-hydrolase [Echinicola jeungdonensis]MDN3668264.1 MBL fold metallo-hydrolase [Echinicola jeungdonensis]
MDENILPISILPADMINCFLIKGKKGHILVDTGLPNSAHKILDQLKERGIDKGDIQLIIVTHCHVDHFGSAGKLKKMLKVPVLAHQLDEAFYLSGQANQATLKPNLWTWNAFRWLIKDMKTYSLQPDILLKNQEEYDLNQWGIAGKVIHTPGHTPGSLSVVLENGNAIIMDMVASGILIGGVMWYSRVKYPPFHDNLKDLKGSFEKLLSENCEHFYLGHGKPITRNQLVKFYDRKFKKVR